MKNLIITLLFFSAAHCFAGPGITGGGSSASSKINDGTGFGNFGNGKIGGGATLEDLLKRNSGDQILAVELGRINGKIKFQTATPIQILNNTNDPFKLMEAMNEATQEPIKWDIKTWQGSEAKIQALPELKNALEYSRTLKNWQQLK